MTEPRDLTRRELVAAGAAAAALQAVPAGALAATRRAPKPSPLLPNARTVEARGLPLTDLSVLELASLLQARRLSAVELAETYVKRARETHTDVNAWIRTYPEQALEQARVARERLSARGVRRAGRAPLVCGVPFAHKDVFAVAGLPLTASSKILRGNVPPRDSEVHRRLRAAGMVLIGHTHTHEFTVGNFTPQCSNPWDHTRTPGGSSGGSAIALATRTIPAATGTDTLGSLRIPAGLCGVSAIKPTRGRVSLDGVIPLAESFDHAGSMARSAADAALLLHYMAGGKQLLTNPKRSGLPLDGLRVGVPTSSFGGVAVDPIIAARAESFAKELADLGATLVSVQAPRSAADNLSSTDGLNFFLTIVGKEIDAYHRRWFPARILDYTNDVSATLTLIRATQTIGITRERARTAVATLKQGWEKAFADKSLDIVLQPAAVIPAPDKSRAVIQTQSMGDAMVVWDYLGWPVVCVPAGKGTDGMPVGVQLVGRPGTERLLCSTAITAQAYYPHHKQRPPQV